MVSLELFTKYYTIGCIAQFKETYPANPLYKLLNGTVNDEYICIRYSNALLQSFLNI